MAAKRGILPDLGSDRVDMNELQCFFSHCFDAENNPRMLFVIFSGSTETLDSSKSPEVTYNDKNLRNLISECIASRATFDACELL